MGKGIRRLSRRDRRPGEAPNKRKQTGETRRLLEHYVGLSPEYWAFETLARSYKDSGDLRALEVNARPIPGSPRRDGPGPRQGENRDLNFYMGQKRSDKAWPYAEAAAESWASAAIELRPAMRAGVTTCRPSSQCTTQSERYPNPNWGQWFVFCKRTGHGDVNAARTFAQQYLQSVGDRSDGVSRVGRVLLLAQRRAQERRWHPSAELTS